MDAALVELLPADLYTPGEHVSAPCWVEPTATHVTLVLEGRPQWQRLGIGSDVLTVSIEVNTHGIWDILGGCSTDSQEKYDRTGTLCTATKVRVRLPRCRIPQPQVRIHLKCFSPCEAAGMLVFDDQPVPVHPLIAHHSVSYDNDNEAVATEVTSLTIGAFAVGNNAQRCMLVGFISYDSTAGDSVIASVSHNGSTTGWASVITELGPGSTTDRASIWRKVAPDAVTATVVITTGGTCSELGGNALSVYGVDQTTPIAGATSAEGTTSQPSLNVAAATGDLVYDVMYAYGGLTDSGVAGASQIERTNAIVYTYIGAQTLVLASTEPGAATVTMSWTLTNITEWVQVACAIKAAAGGVTRYPFRQGIWRQWRY